MGPQNSTTKFNSSTNIYRRRCLGFLLTVGIILIYFLTINTDQQSFHIIDKQLEKHNISNQSNLRNVSLVDFLPVQWYSVPLKPDPNNMWTVLVTSAFYDYRINKVVVLLASNAADLIKNEGIKYKFSCVLFYTDPINGSSSLVEVEGYFFTSYLFYCPVINVRNNGSNEIPKALTIRRNDSLELLSSASWTIPVTDLLERRNRLKSERLLALCVGILFGFQDWLTLLQFIEFHRIQGVEKFIFFYHDMHWSTKEIFRWYTSNFNFIELIYWNPEHLSCRNDYRCQLLRDNLCSYSLMFKYKYVGHLDFDELFFPVQGNLTGLLKQLDRLDRGSFQFKTKFHQSLIYDAPRWENVTYKNTLEVVNKFLPLFHYDNVSTCAHYYYTPKTIAKPETVIKRWVHHVSVHINGFNTYMVKKTEGFMRHFKVRDWWGVWADITDKEVTYKTVNSETEVGKHLLDLVRKNVLSVVLQIKSLHKDQPN